MPEAFHTPGVRYGCCVWRQCTAEGTPAFPDVQLPSSFPDRPFFHQAQTAKER